MTMLATERLARALVARKTYPTPEAAEEAVQRLARAFQSAWIAESTRRTTA